MFLCVVHSPPPSLRSSMVRTFLRCCMTTQSWPNSFTPSIIVATTISSRASVRNSCIIVCHCCCIDAVNTHLHTVWVEKEFKCDRYLAPHTRYFIREMRIKAYTQLLESYRSLSLQHMAKSFGVSIEFIDKYDNLSSLKAAPKGPGL